MSADPPRFDLQSHSTYSDGTLPPAEVVAAAAAAGVELLALTDHDTVDGVAEALAAGRAAGIRVVPAVEISARDRVARRDLHILGYLIDPSAAALGAMLARSRDARAGRGEAMATRLRELGFALPDEALAAQTGGHERPRTSGRAGGGTAARAAGRAVGRPHVARAAFAQPANAARLRAEGIGDPGALLEAYLVPGAPAFVPRATPSVPEAIAAIHRAGGVAVWAHPFFDVLDPGQVAEMTDRLLKDGLDGVEAFYITHTRAETELACDLCAERGLITTGSADFHGPESERFSRFRAFSTYGREPNLGPLAA